MLRGGGHLRSRLVLKKVTGSAAWTNCTLRRNGAHRGEECKLCCTFTGLAEHIVVLPVTDVLSLYSGPHTQFQQQGSQLPPPVPSFRSKERCICTASAPRGTAGAPKSSSPRIFVLGGGFGGLHAAIRLDSLMWPRNMKPSVTLIDQNDRFVFKPLMYELLSKTADESEVAPEYTSLLASHNVRVS
jgi:hypothetical protein